MKPKGQGKLAHGDQTPRQPERTDYTTTLDELVDTSREPDGADEFIEVMRDWREQLLDSTILIR